jgi:GNAT superfamily N-acetyltransferase
MTQGDQLEAGLERCAAWQRPFVEPLWVSDAWRHRGIGRALLAQAEAHAVAQESHSAWLDTFQAQGF